MALLDLTKLTTDLSATWAGYLRDWDRTLRAGNYPETTRYNYLLAAAQLARYLAEHSPDPDAADAAEDPTEVTRGHAEAFQAWMIETRSASTALNKHKGLQQFFKWLLTEEDIDRSPMDRVRQPKTPQKLIPIIRDEDTKKLLDACKGKTFPHLRDEAIIRLYYNTGAPLSEIGNLLLDDVDLNTESVHYHGKGTKDRRVRFGPKTARAISRYLRARGKHKGSELPDLWLADRGGRRLAANGIKIRDSSEAVGSRCGRCERARPPLAAQLRPRVEACRGEHRRSDAAVGLDLGGHAPALRRQRGGRTRPGNPGAAGHRGGGVDVGIAVGRPGYRLGRPRCPRR
ncbi:phage integrase N-terminal SAM-like domain-containing protein [Micromonospora luteifusca]